MTLFICTDERGGMAFNKRRQSSDSVLRADILAECAKTGGRLGVTAYTAKQFSEDDAESIIVSKEGCPLSGLPTDYFWAEFSGDASEILPLADTVIIYNWNRHYPSDDRPDIDYSFFYPEAESEFAGNSHEKITKTVFRRK